MTKTKRTPAGTALTNLIIDLFRLNSRMLTAGDKLVAGLGLTSARSLFLGAITEADRPQPVAWLARATWVRIAKRPTPRTHSSPGPSSTVTGPTSSAAESSSRRTICGSRTRLRNPELLDGLSAAFVKSGYDLKGLIRTICTSRVYGLGSVPNEIQRERSAKLRAALSAADGRRGVARCDRPGVRSADRVRRTARRNPGHRPAGRERRLDVPGRVRPAQARDTACECERVTDATLSQSLMLLNSSEVQTKLSAREGGPSNSPRTRGPTRRRSTNCSGRPLAEPLRPRDRQRLGAPGQACRQQAERL